jgi:hypothetical protein
MAIKYFDINRLVKLPLDHYVCFDDIVGVKVTWDRVETVYTTGGQIDAGWMSLADFEAEVERAIKQTMADQNENLNDFQNELKTKLEEAKQERLFHKTDKISDAN